MTTTTSPPTAAVGPATTAPPTREVTRPLPFTRLLRLELRKLINTRASRGVIIAILLVTAIAIAITIWINRQEGTGLTPLLIAANVPQALLLPVLGVMTAANEWSQKTALITFTQEPRRLRVMAAKTLAVTLLGLAVLVVTVLLAIGAHIVSMTLADSATIDLTLTPASLVNLAVLQVQGVLLGFAFGALFLNAPLGIVAFFLTPMVSTLVFSMTAWLREHAAWLELSASTGPLMGQDWLTADQWARFATSTAIWLLIPLTIGLWRVAHKEVK